MAKMTKTEARELRSLVRSEYGVLKSEISSRRQQVTGNVRDELLALSKKDIAVATTKIERLETKAQDFKKAGDKSLEAVMKKIDKLNKDFEEQKEKHLAAVGKLQKQERNIREQLAEDAKVLIEDGKTLLKELDKDGVIVMRPQGSYHGDSNAGVLAIGTDRGEISVVVSKELETKDFKEKYAKAQQLIAKQAQDVQSALHREEQNMVRDLTLNTLESDQAVAFFHNMPTVSELIPSPDVKQLTA